MNIQLKHYFIGVTWFILSLVVSAMNDVIAKYTGGRLNSFEVSFFRFLFSVLTLLPFIFYYGKDSLRTSNYFIHIIRGALLFFGITAWTYGLGMVHITTATVISFAVPLFVLVLAVFFLNERIIWQRWVVTIIGFVGIAITLNVQSKQFNPEVLIFVFASIAFATLDIINKKYVIKETMISMLFYSSLVTAVLSAPPAMLHWVNPNISELSLLFVLGGGANLILFLLLKAFTLVDATAVAPYRYFELIIASILAYIVFSSLPDKSTLYGALIIIPSTLFIIYSEKKEINQKVINKMSLEAK